MKIAITGANGLVGSRIVELLSPEFTFIPIEHSEVDVTCKDKIAQKINEIDFDIFLHLAAYTNVDKAETEKELAYNLNVNATRYIFDSIQKKGKKMIYFSTDFVFDGVRPPYDENSTPTPIGYYGISKYEGEKIVKNNAMIVRITYPYGKSKSKKKDFVQRLKDLLSTNQSISMSSNSLITPTFIDDIALSLKYLFNNYSPDIFHIIGGKSYSPYEVGKLISKNFGYKEEFVVPISFEKYSLNKATRPQFLETKSIKNNFHKMQSFEEGLANLI